MQSKRRRRKRNGKLVRESRRGKVLGWLDAHCPMLPQRGCPCFLFPWILPAESVRVPLPRDTFPAPQAECGERDAFKALQLISSLRFDLHFRLFLAGPLLSSSLPPCAPVWHPECLSAGSLRESLAEDDSGKQTLQGGHTSLPRQPGLTLVLALIHPLQGPSGSLLSLSSAYVVLGTKWSLD